MGWYVELSPRGVRVGGGFYEASGERLAAIRDAIADDRTGPQLKRLLTKLEKAGFEIGGEQLKTAPRGYDKDHPRIDLLRHKQIIAGSPYGFEKLIHSTELLDRIREDWRALNPLVSWLARVAGVPTDLRAALVEPHLAAGELGQLARADRRHVE